MKKIVVLLSFGILAMAIMVFAAEDKQQELRPAQKAMQARVAWLTAINKNLDAKNFKAIVNDADALATQTKKVGESHPNPQGKEITLAISSLAKDISAAAASSNSDTIKAKLAEIKGKCNECHSKLRDKK